MSANQLVTNGHSDGGWGEMRGNGLYRTREVGGVRRLGGVGLTGPFAPGFSSGAVVPEIVSPIDLKREIGEFVLLGTDPV
jgi:hypothetical protein